MLTDFNKPRGSNGDYGRVVVKTLDDLKTFKPWYSGQVIILERVIPGGAVVNEPLTYMNSVTSGTANNYELFLGLPGTYWKANTSQGYNPLLLLGQNGFSDISACINKIAADLAVKYSTAIGIIDFPTTIRIPAVTFGSNRFVVTGPIYLPSFVTLKMEVDTYFDYYTVTNTDGIVVDNSRFPTLLDTLYTSPDRARQVLLWESERELFVGARLTLTHPIGNKRTSNAGITLGNSVTGFIDVRGCTVRNFQSLGFYYGIKINPIDNYINTFSTFHLGRNNYAIAVIGDSKTNAGEKFAFDNGTIADSDSDLIYVENNAFEMSFSNCSLDYPTGDMLKITKNGNALVIFDRCHIEGVQGMLVNVVNSNTYPKQGKKVTFTNCAMDLRSGQTIWNRTWFYSSVINTYVIIDKTTRVYLGNETMLQPIGAYPALVINGVPANNAIDVEWQKSNEDILTASTIFLGKITPTTTDRRVISTNRFSGTDGTAYSASVSAADSYGWYCVNGSWKYTTADAVDGLQGITVTSDVTTNVYYIMCNIPFHLLPYDKFRALGSIKIDAGYTGNVNVSCGVEVHSLLTMNSTAVSDKTIATSYSSAVDVAALAATNSLIGAYQGFCTQAIQANSFTNTVNPMQFVRVGLRITGFVGTISLKIPTVTCDRIMVN
ncbi:hypothetical protein [Klebsiella pneumoniae]|uniref:hypothetical protein n=1 Tax=Klebsiella pneumoniae TaxID=573 RepID=UPI000D1A4206|nr:hypothetical protein [Klebsiella pneumoniae]